jgi:hypothetical protein
VHESRSVVNWNPPEGCSSPTSEGFRNDYLLALDSQGAATQVLLGSSTWTSGGGTAPGVSGLLADARGNFVVRVGSEDRVMGPGSPGPAVPVTSGSIVSADGFVIANKDGVVDVRDSGSGVVAWSVTHHGTPVTTLGGLEQAPGFRPVVLLDNTTLHAESPTGPVVPPVELGIVPKGIQYRGGWVSP